MRKFLASRAGHEIAIGLISLSGAGAIFLTGLVHFYPTLIFDVKISREVQEGGTGLLPLMEFISFFGIPIVGFLLTSLTTFVFYIFSFRREALFVLSTFIFDGMNALIKLVIHRPRPTDTFISVYQQLTDPSFPSGHVVHYVVFFGFLVAAMIVPPNVPRILKWIVVPFSLGLIVLVSVSRIYLGAHWATDVIGGYCLGFLMLSFLLYAYFEDIDLAAKRA